MKIIKEENTGAVLPIITVEEMKQHLRVSSDIDNDYIEVLIDTATQYIQNITGKSIIETNYIMFLDNFPVDEIVIPHPPVITIDKVECMDINDNIIELDTSAYLLIQSFARPDGFIITDIPNINLKSREGIAVSYTAGYESVPLELTQAVRFLVTHWFETREAFLSNHSFEVPFGVKHLLMNFREY